ncbi:hypothetical protein [Burkholderia vietnamiensis]|uniref:hypothetical protein n=1 Tax=Burkholderia vietnamiensis TaxID=60552 RepID=UPI001588DB19|nr:hypothetical protein [Burkholderia vietnamiensis]
MAFDFYIGSTFNYAGTFQLSGPTPGGTFGTAGNQPDFSQYSITAGMYDQTGEKLYSHINVSNCSIASNPDSNGVVIFNATADVTATWPQGKAQLAAKVITQDGSVLVAPPIWFRLKASPITQGGSQ